MDIIKEITDKLMDETDRKLSLDNKYLAAEKEIHDFIMENVPEKEEEFEFLLGLLTSTIERKALETGMKYGVKVTVELMK